MVFAASGAATLEADDLGGRASVTTRPSAPASRPALGGLPAAARSGGAQAHAGTARVGPRHPPLAQRAGRWNVWRRKATQAERLTRRAQRTLAACGRGGGAGEGRGGAAVGGGAPGLADDPDSDGDVPDLQGCVDSDDEVVTLADLRRTVRKLGPVQRFMRARGLPVPPLEPEVLVACEFSGRVRDAYIRRGVAAISCDILPTESDGPHFEGDVRELLALKRWRIVVAFPPCTHTAYSGGAYFAAKRADGRQLAGIEFIALLLCADADAVIIEQPRSVFGEVYGPPDVSFHPYHFGDGEVKQTWLWCAGSAPVLRPTTISAGRHPRSALVRAPTAAERRRRRSIIPLGLADAIAAQIRPDTLLAAPRPPLDADRVLAHVRSAYGRMVTRGRARMPRALHEAAVAVMLPSDAAPAAPARREADDEADATSGEAGGGSATVGPTTPTRSALSAADAGIETVDITQAGGGQRALLVPVCVLGRPLVLLPAAPRAHAARVGLPARGRTAAAAKSGHSRADARNSGVRAPVERAPRRAGSARRSTPRKGQRIFEAFDSAAAPSALTPVVARCTGARPSWPISGLQTANVRPVLRDVADVPDRLRVRGGVKSDMYDVWAVWVMYDVWDVWDVWRCMGLPTNPTPAAYPPTPGGVDSLPVY